MTDPNPPGHIEYFLTIQSASRSPRPVIGRYLSAIFPLKLFEPLESLDDNGIDLIVVNGRMDQWEAWAWSFEGRRAQSIHYGRPYCVTALDVFLATPTSQLGWSQADISLRLCPPSTTTSLLHSSILFNRTYSLPVLVLGTFALRARLDDLSILSPIKPVSPRRLQRQTSSSPLIQYPSRSHGHTSPWRQPQTSLTLQITPPPLSDRPSTLAVMASIHPSALAESIVSRVGVPLAP